MQNKSLRDYLNQLQELVKLSNYEDCIKLLNDAIYDYPDDNKLKLNLGNIYKLLDQTTNAIDIFSSLTSSDHGALANNNLSLIYLELGQLDRSIEHAEKALEINQDYDDAKFNLALAHFNKKNLSTSSSLLEDLQSSKEFSSRAMELKIRIQQINCDWSRWNDTLYLLSSNKLTVHPFLHVSHINDEKLNFINAKDWANHESLSDKSTVNMAKKPDVKIKLGFFCGEIRNHPTFHLIKNLFKEIDKNKFIMTMFSYDHEEVEKNYIKNEFHDFVDISYMKRNEANACIKNFDIDVLIDLTTIISDNRQYILDNDSAKIIIAYLGFPGTTGNVLYDYILTDSTTTPMHQQEYYTEKFLFLPNTYQVNDGDLNTLDTPPREKFNLPTKGIILGSLNQSFKLDPQTFNIWMEILKKYDDTYLWLLDEGADMRANIKACSENYVDSNRIIFAEKVDRSAHLSRINLIDIALDTLIYNGHTTTLEMLQSGVPVVTCKGHHFASRVSASLLNTLGVSDLIANDIHSYRNIIVNLIEDKSALERIKEKINLNLKKSNLFDIKGFAGSFEAAITSLFT